MRLRALLLLVLASFGFGTGNVVTKALLNRGLQPTTVIAGRYLLAILALLAGLAVTGHLRRSGPAAWRQGVVLGLINMAAPTFLTTFGLVYLPASITAMLVALIPLTTVVIAHFLIDEEPMRAALLPGFVLALAGCVLLVRGDTTAGPHLGLGLSLVLAGIVTAGLGGALTRRFALGRPATQLVVPQFIAAGLVALAFALPSHALAGLAQMGVVDWILVLVSATVATALPFVALLLLSEIATAAKTSLVAYLVPLVGVTGSVLLLREPLTWGLVVGGALILFGVVIAERAERRHQHLPPVPV
ncbi:MAG TPA: DMT family transporter [Acidimicrobiia bacterium]|nr:DMT family transporter [Acidimicrobiia bacterium]